jgi:hypothetical protein
MMSTKGGRVTKGHQHPFVPLPPFVLSIVLVWHFCTLGLRPFSVIPPYLFLCIYHLSNRHMMSDSLYIFTTFLRIILNIDSVHVTSRSHIHPSHSQTSRSLTSSLSLGVPVTHKSKGVQGLGEISPFVDTVWVRTPQVGNLMDKSQYFVDVVSTQKHQGGHAG